MDDAEIGSNIILGALAGEISEKAIQLARATATIQFLQRDLESANARVTALEKNVEELSEPVASADPA